MMKGTWASLLRGRNLIVNHLISQVYKEKVSYLPLNQKEEVLLKSLKNVKCVKEVVQMNSS